MKILIVDDSKYLRNKLKQMVNKSYKDVLEAGSEKEAEELINEYKIDLIFLDIIMENQDSGIRILKKLKQKSKKTKVIIVSVVENDEIIGEAMRIGADGYISKPVDEEKLFKEIKKVIK